MSLLGFNDGRYRDEPEYDYPKAELTAVRWRTADGSENVYLGSNNNAVVDNYYNYELLLKCSILKRGNFKLLVWGRSHSQEERYLRYMLTGCAR